MIRPFVIFAMPRSRSAWLARFLTYGDWHCGHDELRHCRSFDDVSSWLALPCTGTIETGAASFWRLLPRYCPEARVLTLRRPVPEVVASLRRGGLPFEDEVMIPLMRRHERKLDQIEQRMPNVMSVEFSELADEQKCAAVFEHCLPYRHDHAWWQAVAGVNIQISLMQMARYFIAHKPQLTKLAKQAKHRMLVDLQGAHPVSMEGMTFSQEPFAAWYRDGQALFSEHCMQVGESPDEWQLKNKPLVERLAEVGALQITTARSNGRMFGYLMTVIAPSLEAEGRLTATNTTFYCSPDVKGLGLKLQRASLQALRERGVDELYMHAGPRGLGPRMPVLYRRMGAEENGQWFKLTLGA